MARMYLPLLLTALVSWPSVGQNVPPLVDAGPDTTTRLGREFRLLGQVRDDSLLNAEPVTTWTLIGGPAGGLEILVPDHIYSRVVLKDTGTYRLSLSAHDGEFTVSDSMKITVLDSIPFLILTPVPGQEVTPGDSLLITWQVDPPGSVVLLEYSIDGGIDWDYMASEGIRGESFTWHVPDTLAVSGGMMMRARVLVGSRRSPSVGLSLVGSKARQMVRGHFNRDVGMDQKVFSVNGRRIGGMRPAQARRGAAFHGVQIVTTGGDLTRIAVVW